MQLCYKKEQYLTYCFIIFVSGFLITPPSAISSELHLALADSTCLAMQEVGNSFSRKTGIKLVYTCDSSGILARGIKAGVINADFFLSANGKWMQNIVDQGLINPQRVRRLLRNDLIVATRHDNDISMEKVSDLTAPAVKTIIIGNPSRAPLGRYTKQALQKKGLWQQVRPKIIITQNISAAIATLKAADQYTVAILYRSALTDSMRLLATIPQEYSDPIEYYSAPLKDSKNKQALVAFLSFLDTDHFRKIFTTKGFAVQFRDNR
jgi:molybdate transport system substrate-binding protein